ncbi:MAG TPA: HAMP domain-containing sensor histidine kinase [Myxococcota bacterium]|nr:HAMP domain-containing sensor histidine kinase [Myxococcota bacterium]
MSEPTTTPSGRSAAGWLVLAAVAIPLAILLLLQLRTLQQLEETATLAQRAAVRGYAKAVVRSVEDLYREKARLALGVPADWVREGRTEALAAHFAGQDGRGVRAFFVLPLAADAHAAAPLFFDPAGHAVAFAPDSPEARAAKVAAAAWQLVAADGGTLESTTPIASEQFTDRRVVARPLVDGAARPVGAAGILVDDAWVRSTFLPERIAAERELLGEPLQDQVSAVIRTGVAAATPAERAAAPDAVQLPFRFLFTDWALTIEGPATTPARFVRQSLLIDLALSLVMTAVLLAAIALALRSAVRATRLSRMKTEFVSSVSHELRTPLASIRVLGEFLRLGRVTDPEKLREYGETIEAESGRLTRLVNDILDFSKLESGRRALRFEAVDLAAVVDETLRAFAGRLEREGFRVDVRAPRALPAAWADRDAVGQVLANLLDNAIKYSGAARTIEIELAPESGGVRLSVADRGAGIAPGEQRRIFEAFYRAGSELVPDAKGSGLGLAIVKRVVEAHGGSVDVESRPGAGSRFDVHWPAHGVS